ncbi:MAG: MBG domain-containing protein, partial [Candidatus Methanomethylophilaceae archaeon]
GYEWDDGSDTNKEISWAIFKKALTVTADSKNMVFLGAVPEFTATYSGFVGGETEKALTGNLRFNCGYDGKSYQKTFLITPEGLVSDNYEIEFVSGTLTVGRISVTVPDAAADLVYNGDFQTGISEGTGYTVSGGCKKDAGSHVSTLKLLPGHVWSDSSDSDKKISWVIAKKSLKVTADSKIMNFLGDVPVFTVTYSGFEGEENESVLGGTLKFQCGYSGKYYQETFSITPSGLTSDNYALTFKDGTLTVLRALADVPRPLTELVYDGTEQTGVEGNGYDVVRGSTYAVNAGKYTVSVSPKDGYMWPDGTLDMKTAEWSIARKEVKVVTDSAEKVYDGKALSASGRIEGLVEGDGVIFRVTGERTVTGSSPNTYVLTFNGTGNVGNYKVTENLGTLKITAAHLNRPAAGKTLIMYDGTEKTYLPAGFVGNAMKIRGNIGTEPGFYGVTVSIKDMLNYSWTDGTQSEMKFGFRIVPRVLPEAEAIAPAVYTGENQVPVLTLKYGDTILREGRDYSAVWNSEDFVGAGTYTADVKGIGVYSDFYTVEYVIEKIRLNRPSADPSSFLYDGTEKTYSPAGFDGTVMDISGNKRTERGTQTVSVSIKDKANYEWNDGTSEDAEFVFTVGRLSIPEFGIDGTVYSGNRQIPEFVIRDGSRVLKEGTDYETVWDSTDFVCAGVYSASVTGIGVYSGTRTVPYVIERIKLDKPSEDSTVFVCDGTEKVYCPGGFDCGLMCMEGNTAVSAGTHNVSVSVKDSVNYEWADGTQDVLNFRFDVAAVPEPPLVEKYESIPSVTGAIAAAAVLALCYVCFFRRP